VSGNHQIWEHLTQRPRDNSADGPGDAELSEIRTHNALGQVVSSYHHVAEMSGDTELVLLLESTGPGIVARGQRDDVSLSGDPIFVFERLFQYLGNHGSILPLRDILCGEFVETTISGNSPV